MNCHVEPIVTHSRDELIRKLKNKILEMKMRRVRKVGCSSNITTKRKYQKHRYEKATSLIFLNIRNMLAHQPKNTIQQHYLVVKVFVKPMDCWASSGSSIMHRVN